MLKKNKNNDGMSLVEVIVSMLVLSIAVVAVTMSFTTATKINTKSKKQQSVAALMENLTEYAEAGGTEYKTWFSYADGGYSFTDDGVKKIETLKGIGQGLYQYDVRITTDREPAEYNTAKMNNFGLIQFGGSGSNSILIDASLDNNDNDENGISDYDESAFEYFSVMHSSAVTQNNLIEEQTKLENPNHNMDLWVEVPADEIPEHIDRELQLVVKTPITGKMQLTANFVYKLDTSLQLPAGEEHVMEVPVYVSEVYDVASNESDDARRLNQIYILYSPSVDGESTYGAQKDIRLWDAAKALKANIFIANQTVGDVNTDINTAIGMGSLANRAGAMDKINVSFQDPSDSMFKDPKGGEIHCSCKLTVEKSSTEVSYKENSLVATGEGARIVTTTVEILELSTDTVLASKKITHLR